MAKTHSVGMGFCLPCHSLGQRFWSVMEPGVLLGGIRRREESSSKEGVEMSWKWEGGGSTPKRISSLPSSVPSPCTLPPHYHQMPWEAELWGNGNLRTPNKQGRWTDWLAVFCCQGPTAFKYFVLVHIGAKRYISILCRVTSSAPRMTAFFNLSNKWFP